ncbi:MAG: hypothetical protein AAGM21_12060 [Pseudomonadota bacterium]
MRARAFERIFRVALLAALGVFASTASADVRSLEIPADAPVHLSNPHSWTPTCRLLETRVLVVNAPKNGRIYTQDRQHRIGDFGGGRLASGRLDDCTATLVDGFGLFYDPTDGFTGADAFSVVLEFERAAPLEINY